MRSEKAARCAMAKDIDERPDAQSERLEGLVRETLLKVRKTRNTADEVLRSLQVMTAASHRFVAEDRNDSDVERDAEPAWRQAA